MERIEKSKLAKMFLLLSFFFLLLLIPFVSTSFRSSYLYFLFNLLIIILCFEAGLLKKQVATKEAIVAKHNDRHDNYVSTKKDVVAVEEKKKMVPKMVEVVERVQKFRRCPSRPSIFFIGSCDVDPVEEEKEQAIEVEKMGELSKQELFMKAEMFIGNFYNQLKMQKEKSWNNIHGLCQKAF